MTSRRNLKEVTFTFEGRRYHCYGKTKAEAREKASAKKALLKARVRESKGGYTVDRWAYEWLDTYKAEVSSHWQQANRRIIENDIIPIIGGKAITDIKPKDITATVNNLSKYSESYALKAIHVLRQIFRAAEDNDIIIKDPTRNIKMPKCKPSTSRRTITPFERELTIRTAVKHPEDGLFFLIMLYCGLRPQEVSALQFRDIDKKAKVIHVTKARKADGTIGDTKSTAGVRDVPIPDALMSVLPTGKQSEYVCTNTYGEPLIRESVQRMWKRFKREMELEYGTKTYRNKLINPILPDDLTPYCYRHTYCTDLQDAGVPLVVASRFMGHSDIGTTAKIYTHNSNESFSSARDLINLHQGTTEGTTP